MTVFFKIKDGEGTKLSAGVTSSHSLKVSLTQTSANDFTDAELTRNKILRTFLTNSLNSKEMNINGSVTNQVFSITSKVGFVQYIQHLRFIFNDGNMDITTPGQLRRFGDAAIAPGLTNGILLNINQSGIITDIFSSPIQNIADFFNYADDFTNFTDGIDINVDLLTIDFDFETPIVLPSGTTDSIYITIRDDLTSVDLFNVIAHGYQERV